MRHPVIVVGGGPVGLTAAIDLANHGINVVLLDEDNTVSEGSRAICFAKRSLEVFDRLECVEPMRDIGITWNLGRLFYCDREVYSFNLQPESGYAHPAFINLQQYYLEEYLINHLNTLPNAKIRWQNKVVAITPNTNYVELTIATPDGLYKTECDYLIACDGTRSSIRSLMKLDYEGIFFEEKFLITDVVMKADFPTERWFWFDPPFHPGYSALLHRQPNNVWRIDLQLGRNANVEEEKRPEKVIPRIKAMLGDNVDFDLEWISIYSFQSRMLEQFYHGRVIFAGDSAHIMSPFGARGANSGIQDVDNLIWKLKLVLKGHAPSTLLESYNEERVYAAKENLFHTESSTEFISPNNKARLALRNAVLELAKDYAFARPLINSGRLSTATVMPHSSLNTLDEEVFNCSLELGSPAADAPILIDNRPTWFLKQLGYTFNGLLFINNLETIPPSILNGLIDLTAKTIPIKTYLITHTYPNPTFKGLPVLIDHQHYLQNRYDAQPNTFYLIRPDQHIAARWRDVNFTKIKTALAKACCISP